MAGALEGKSTIVTGAAGGIGSVAAQLFAREGARVLLTDVAEESGEAAAKAIRDEGGEAIFMRVDITDEDQVEAMVRRAVEAFGGLDCALNNVGVGASGRMMTEVARADAERVLTINVLGTWMCLKHEIPRLVEKGGGTIVNTSSMSGVLGNPGGSFYSASKHAVNGLTKSAAAEWGRLGVRVNAICPGVVNTPQMLEAAKRGMDFNKRIPTALKRGAEPLEVAELALWLLSPRSSYVTGQAIQIDGGRSASTFFPD